MIFKNFSVIFIFSLLIFLSCSIGQSFDIVEDPVIPDPPVFDPPTGKYDKDIQVSLTSNVEKSFIYYTNDGTDPTDKSQVYENPIPITGVSAVVIKAVVITSKDQISEISMGEYNVYYIPSAPTAPSLTFGDSQLKAAWSPVTGASSYNVYYSTENNSATAKQSGGDIKYLTQTITGLTNDTKYYIWIKAKNSAGISPFSPAASAVPMIQPTAPSGLSVVEGRAQLSVSWNSIGNAECYNIFYSITNDFSTALQSGGDIIALNYTIPSLTNFATYYIWVKAKNAAGTGEYSTSIKGIPFMKDTYTADGVSFRMSFVSANKTFPLGETDRGKLNNVPEPTPPATATFNYPIWIAETETTYQLWKAVYDWATHTDRGANKYTFANPGVKGNDDAADKSVNHPVTTINWRDAIIWCNALTEWYNAKNGTALTPVYYADSTYATPIRTSTNSTTVNTTLGSEDNPYIRSASTGNNVMSNCNATGFRLPTSYEWEMAARYRGTDKTNTVDIISDGIDFANPPDGLYWTKGNSISGAADFYSNITESNKFAVLNELATAPVKSNLPNTLGLYDVSGNVHEWCFDLRTLVERIMRGSHYGSSYDYQVQLAYLFFDIPYRKDQYSGFRFVRSE